MLKTVIDHFSGRLELPIEVDEVATYITESGWQDEIHFLPIDCDPAEIRGLYTQFTYRKAVYGDPQFVTHIGYSSNVSPEWQRVICVKEMVHIFDRHEAKTDTPEQVDQLLDKLVGPLSSEDYGVADWSAAKDRIALYQGLPLLFPRACLNEAKIAVAAGRVTIEEVALWAKMPVNLVHLMMSDDWLTHTTVFDTFEAATSGMRAAGSQ